MKTRSGSRRVRCGAAPCVRSVRPLVGAFAIGALIFALSAPAMGLVISEIHYHVTEPENPNLEFIEVYNENPDPLDLTGYTICNGVDFEFPDGLFLEGKSFLVICSNEAAIQAEYGITNTVGDWTGALSNGGERVEICNPAGITIAEVRYNDRGKWRVGADGTGHTLALVQPYLENDDGDSWTLSDQIGGTPGEANSGLFEVGVPGGDTGDGVDPNGFITKWLVLGPYQGSSCNLGGRLTEDWLRESAGGDVETDLLWEDDRVVNTNYSLAESTGLHPNSPTNTPTIAAYSSFGDTINYNDAVWPPDPNNVMAYAFCYVDNIADTALAVDVAVASDDGISVLLNGDYVHSNDACRGVGGSGEVQDRAPATLQPGKNLVVVKVFENGGGWSFRFRFERRNTGTPLASNSEIQVTLDHTLGMNFGGGGDPIEEPGDPPPPPPTGGGPAPRFPVLINEALLRTGDEPWIELHNTSSQNVDISGFHLTDQQTDLTKYTIPAGTNIPGGGYRTFNGSDLGFDLSPALSGLNVFIAFVNDTGDQVLDAYNFRPDYDDMSEARVPDGDTEFSDASDPTPGAANEMSVNDDIVINEVMFHPIDQSRNREYIEFYNRGSTGVDMSGWALTNGVDFVFPPGTSLGAGDYLVVARDPDLIRSIYGLGGEVIGPETELERDDFGSLSDRGERVTLQDTLGRTVDTIRYYDGGEWPRWTDGLGSSLELIDPEQDNRFGQAWDASDDSAKAPVTEIDYIGRHGGEESELHIALLARGITIVDDVSVIGGGTTFDDTPLIAEGAIWRYFKGRSNPPADWTEIDFNDGSWLSGATGIGYGDNDDATVLSDMEDDYMSIFCRREFNVANPAGIDELVFTVVIDDGFYAYLNGTQVASHNVSGKNYNDAAPSAGEPELRTVDISSFKNLLVSGTNVFAVQVHNAGISSSDLSFDPALVDRTTIFSGGSEQISNGTFNSNTSGWIIEGTHDRSDVTTIDPITGAGSLKVIATGRGDNKVNRIETSNSGIGALNTNEDLQISLKARWVVGSQTILTHGYRHAMAKSHELIVPENLGTPGARNSVTQRLIDASGSSNLGPVITDVRQDPAVPGDNESVTVWARVSDTDGVANVTVRYSTSNPSSSPSSRTMTHIGGGIYEATLPGRPLGTRVVYHIESSDNTGRDGRYPVDITERTHPLIIDPSSASLSEQRHIIYGHDEKMIDGRYHNYRFWMTSNDESYLTNRRRLSNALIPGSFVFGSEQIYYESKTRFSGSPFARGSWGGSFRVAMPRHDPLHGWIRKFNLEDHHGNGANARERISHYLLRQQQSPSARVPYSEVQTMTRWKVNSRGSAVREHVWVPDSQYISLWFPGDSDGAFFEVDDRFVIRDDGSRAGNTNARVLYPPPSSRGDGNGENKENYRWFFGLRMNNGADDFSRLIEFARIMDPGATGNTAYDNVIFDVANVEEMLRMWAVRLNTDDWDHWGANRGKNCYLYEPEEDRRWNTIAWDMELTYGNVDAFMIPSNPNSTYSPGGFAEVQRLFSRLPVKRMYYGILAEMVCGSDPWFHSDYLSPYMERLGALGMNNVQVGLPGGYIDQRHSRLKTRIESVCEENVAFRISTNSGNDFSTDEVTVDLSGNAPIDVQVITVNDEAYPVRFTSMTGWRIDDIALHGGANELTLLAFTLKGDFVALDTITVTTTVDWDPPSLTTISPDTAALGTTVTIEGADFRDGIRVFFGTEEATGVEFDEGVDPTSLTALVPAGTEGPVSVTVRNIDGQTSNAVTFTYLPPPPTFVRGDANGDGRVDVSDPLKVLLNLFGGVPIDCEDALDANDDESANIADAMYILAYLFQNGPAMPAPFPAADVDPSGDALGCAR